MNKSFYLFGLLIFLNVSSAVNLLVENWELNNLNQWNSWGSPAPILNSSVTALDNYSLDPNGDGSYHSGVVSQQMFNLTSGIRLTLDAYIESALAWSELEFGLVNSNTITTNPNTSLYTMASVLIDADTQGSGYKLYANFSGEDASQTIIKNDLSSNYFNAWHNFTFDFEIDGSVTIGIDDHTVFASESNIFDYENESNFSIMFAVLSYGSTNNLYDNISLVQIPESNHFSLISATLILFVLIICQGKFIKANSTKIIRRI